MVGKKRKAIISSANYKFQTATVGDVDAEAEAVAEAGTGAGAEGKDSMTEVVAEMKEAKPSREYSKRMQRVRFKRRKKEQKQHKEQQQQQRKHNEVLKREDDVACKTAGTSVTKRPLLGLILAVSTLDMHDATLKGVTSKPHSGNSYKYVVKECQKAGAIVTAQVHGRVHALVCNRSAVVQATQRVRKAIKKKVDIVDLSWVRDSVRLQKKMDLKSEQCKYLLNVLASDSVAKWERRDGRDDDVSKTRKDNILDPNAGWTSPVNLDCCCVCHENGDDGCPWCRECNITLEKTNQTTTRELKQCTYDSWALGANKPSNERA